MATATIDSAAWGGASAVHGKAHLKAWPLSLARPRRVFLAAELALLTVAWLQTVWGGRSLGTLVLIASCALFFHFNNVDRSLVSSDSSEFCVDHLECVFFGLLASALLFHLLPVLAPRADVAVTAALLIGLLPIILRFCLRHLVTRGKFVEQILIVGTGELPAKLHRALGRGLRHSRRNTLLPGHSENLTDRGVSVDLSELSELVAKNRISRVVIAEPDEMSRERLAAGLLDSRLRGLQVSDAVDFYEEVSGKIWVEALNSQWFVYTNGFNRSQAGVCLKRCFDVTFALLLILFASPLLLFAAIAIKFDSDGPVLFRQVRVGLHGKTFIIYKFRSMRQDAESAAGPMWTAEGDERVTRVGRLLRMFRMDEIPQAFNVLIGDMSIVGPRPERPFFVDRLEQEIPFYNIRHYLKPGITGWAQVMYRYGASVEDSCEKLQYDFYYAKHKSFRCDAIILWKTIRIVLRGRGR
jgi:sugar transferase (PEP-CTERM system associated)